jgi:FkbM family methyltransferase
MSLRQAAYNTLNRGFGRRLIGLAATAVETAQRKPSWITYDSSSGLWLKRTRGGATLVPRPRDMTAEQWAEITRDVFMHRYTVGPGDVVLDIGAGIGTEVLVFSSMVGHSGEVVAVEAHPATFATLERLCQLNRVGNVELIQAAVMDSDRPVTISDLPAERSIENRIVADGIEVPAVTIRHLVCKFKLDRIDFLKMNIEGAEVAALRGARDVLPIVRNAAIGCHDFLADETGDESFRTKEAVHALLVEAGFNVTGRDEDPRPWAADYLFASR